MFVNIEGGSYLIHLENELGLIACHSAKKCSWMCIFLMKQVMTSGH